MLNNRILIAILIIMALPSILAAQPDDWEYWTSLKAEKKLHKGLEFSLEQEFRFDRDGTSLKNQQTSVGLEYEINKHFKFSLNFRYKTKRKDTENQLYAAAYYSKNIWELELNYRLKYQKKFPRKDPEIDRIRNRLELKLEKSKKIRPYISAELFYHAFYEKGDRFDEARYIMGLEWNLNKDNKVDLYFMIYNEFNIKKPYTANAIGMNYSVEL